MSTETKAQGKPDLKHDEDTEDEQQGTDRIDVLQESDMPLEDASIDNTEDDEDYGEEVPQRRQNDR